MARMTSAEQAKSMLRIRAAPIIKSGIDRGLGWQDINVLLKRSNIDFKDGGQYVRNLVLRAGQ